MGVVREPVQDGVSEGVVTDGGVRVSIPVLVAPLLEPSANGRKAGVQILG